MNVQRDITHLMENGRFNGITEVKATRFRPGRGLSYAENSAKETSVKRTDFQVPHELLAIRRVTLSVLHKKTFQHTVANNSKCGVLSAVFR